MAVMQVLEIITGVQIITVEEAIMEEPGVADILSSQRPRKIRMLRIGLEGRVLEIKRVFAGGILHLLIPVWYHPVANQVLEGNELGDHKPLSALPQIPIHLPMTRLTAQDLCDTTTITSLVIGTSILTYCLVEIMGSEFSTPSSSIPKPSKPSKHINEKDKISAPKPNKSTETRNTPKHYSPAEIEARKAETRRLLARDDARHVLTGRTVTIQRGVNRPGDPAGLLPTESTAYPFGAHGRMNVPPRRTPAPGTTAPTGSTAYRFGARTAARGRYGEYGDRTGRAVSVGYEPCGRYGRFGRFGRFGDWRNGVGGRDEGDEPAVLGAVEEGGQEDS
ncbi:MAG: hypothetical protein Q9218_003826 [Villophora microphyllina]